MEIDFATGAGFSVDFTTASPATFVEEVTNTLPQFNPSLGTLLSVSFYDSQYVTMDMGITATPIDPTASLSVTSVMTMTYPWGATSTLSMSRSIPCDWNYVTFCTHSLSELVTQYVSSPSVDLAPFIGTGSVELRGRLEARSTATGVSPEVGASVRSSSIFHVFYTYEPAPTSVPDAGGSFSLFAAGLGALAVKLRRRAPNKVPMANF